LKVSALSFGTWLTVGGTIDQDTTNQCVQVAYDHGVNFFDTAEIYSRGQSEIALGKALKGLGARRQSLVVSTKLYWGGVEGKIAGPNDNGLSRKHIIEGLTTSLKRLDLEYVDLVYAHRPDVHTPMEETVRAFNYLIDKGMAFYWGTSEWTASQLLEAYRIARRDRLIPPTMEQPEYNMLKRYKVEYDYLPLYKKGLGLTTWSPLKFGILTGKYKNGAPPGSRATNNKNLDDLLKSEEGKKAVNIICPGLEEIAKDLNCSIASLAIAWCLKK